MVKNYVVVIVVVIAAALLLLPVDQAEGKEEESRYLNEWAVEIEGGLNHARSVAERHGFELIGQMPFIANHYIVKHVDVPVRSKRSADHHTTRLTEDSQVKWAEQQFVRARSKRGHTDALPQWMPPMSQPKETKCKANHWLPFNDPDYPCQWYMVGEEKHEYTSNVMKVWAQGITGRGVVVCVVDDGIEHTHTDLFPNYDPHASWDLNSNDSDPMPHYNEQETNKHGTRCAGEIAMVANNRKCGVGIAYNCNIGGIRLLDGNVTDRLEAEALSFNHTHIDVYSLSWGPTDDGKTLDQPHRLAQKAMKAAVTYGRGGKGVIYTLASGNGGGSNDDCNCDGYAASMYTISVSSVSRDGNKTFYGECCASSLTTTYSSGTGGGVSVVSTDLHDKCTHQHSGTSASAPMASGFIALALEANPNLTWRDVQHLVVITSEHDQLTKDGLYKNAANFCVNPAFGFGLMNPEKMVRWAKKWKPVPEQRVCHSTTIVNKPSRTNHWSRDVRGGGEVNVIFDVDYDCCRKNRGTVIKYLEHVQFIFTMNYTTRGAISAYATSPSGTVTALLSPRTRDNSTENFEEWPLMSVHTWGEDPCGKWTFRVADEGRVGRNNSGALLDVKMVLYGTATIPFYRKYSSIYCKLPIPSTPPKVQAGLKIGGFKPFGGMDLSKYLGFRDTDETNKSSA